MSPSRYFFHVSRSLRIATAMTWFHAMREIVDDEFQIVFARGASREVADLAIR